VTDKVLARIVALKAMPIDKLKQTWRDLYQTEPPAYNRRHLENRLTYRIQELAYGGLKPATVKRLEELGEQLDGGNPRVRSRRVDNRPLAGTRLIREWKGSNHEIIVQPDYFEFNGRRYKSLSHIAREITGTVWNGWTFFGLKKAGGLA
jgi:hypothetical protein